jgi:hypothetical protein
LLVILNFFHFFSDEITKERKKQPTLHKDSKVISSVKPEHHSKSLLKEEKRLVGKKPIYRKTTLEMSQPEPKVAKPKNKEENNDIENQVC